LAKTRSGKQSATELVYISSVERGGGGMYPREKKPTVYHIQLESLRYLVIQ
jgi:hypothetical protein